jgi:hypothetical protein
MNEARHITALRFLRTLAAHEYGLSSSHLPLPVLHSTRQWCRRNGYAEHRYHGPGNVDPRWHITPTGKAYLATWTAIRTASPHNAEASS